MGDEHARSFGRWATVARLERSAGAGPETRRTSPLTFMPPRRRSRRTCCSARGTIRRRRAGRRGWELEVAGVVLESPAGSRWENRRQGLRTCLAAGDMRNGVAVPANLAVPVPEGLSMVEAAAIPEAFATSYLNLCIEAGMKAGDRVLIQAGAKRSGDRRDPVGESIGRRSDGDRQQR